MFELRASKGGPELINSDKKLPRYGRTKPGLISLGGGLPGWTQSRIFDPHPYILKKLNISPSTYGWALHRPPRIVPVAVFAERPRMSSFCTRLGQAAMARAVFERLLGGGGVGAGGVGCGP